MIRKRHEGTEARRHEGGGTSARTPLARWFHAQGWRPFAFQEATWAAYRRGESGLVHAPTGIGKTLAVWGGPLLEWLEDPRANGTRHGAGTVALRVLWITPLRALARDTVRALQAPLEELGVPWSVDLRTGDTPAAVRQRQRRRLPTGLVTTPESLSLLLSYAGAARRFGTLRAVVVDEWHELLGTKRGVQLELCLARLRAIAPGLRTWGLSATLGNVEEAMDALLGVPAGDDPPGRLVRGPEREPIDLRALRPASVQRFPWAGHLGLMLLPGVLEALEQAASTLIFTNTRSQAELWFRAIVTERPRWVGEVAVHHGSLERGLRRQVEARLAEGTLRGVVCTSSLDLGVDFSPVDQVIQVGSPKGIGRLLQRAGRSGHRPGGVSRILGVPTNALELVEFAAAREAARAGEIEKRPPVPRPLDVLVQHLVTVALGDGFDAEAMRREVRGTHAYRDLSDDDWRWALDFVARGGPTLRAYPQYARVVERAGLHRVESARLGRLHRLSIGTIVGDGAMRVRFVGGQGLGTIEERFIGRLRPGDRFVFAGRDLELVRVREMTAWVRRAPRGGAAVARWLGGRSPLSTELAAAVRRKLDEARRGIYAGEEMALVRPLLELQARWSVIPAAGELLVEATTSRAGHHRFVFTFAGRLVNEGLSALVAHRITRAGARTVNVTGNDLGFELQSRRGLPDDPDSWRRLLEPESLLEDLLACLNQTELARRYFREIAQIAGLVCPGYPGQGKPLRQLQASSELFFEVFREFDPDNRLLAQARREALDRELEIARLRATLERMAAERLRVQPTRRFTPLAFPLLVERLRSRQLSSEPWRDRVERMVVQLERAADKGGR